MLPHRGIGIVARQDSSGTTNAFTNHLAAIDPTWRAQGFGIGKLIEWPAATVYGTGNEGVASRIKLVTGSIGYVEYGFAKRLGLPMAVLQNKAGAFVEPNLAAGQSALSEAAAASPKTLAALDSSIVDPSGSGAYPIVTFSWLLLYRQYADPAKDGCCSRLCCLGAVERPVLRQGSRLHPAAGQGGEGGKTGVSGYRPLASLLHPGVERVNPWAPKRPRR